MSLREQTTQRKRQSHTAPAGIYHDLGDRTALQENIAKVTLEHVRAGRAADFRNLAITYPHAYNLVWAGLDEMERIEYGMTCPVTQLIQRMTERRVEREAQLDHYR